MSNIHQQKVRPVLMRADDSLTGGVLRLFCLGLHGDAWIGQKHHLPLKKGFRPFQQRARQMRTKVLEVVKKEIERMLKVGFIRSCRYVEWISSIGPIQKKDGWW
jgi:hypothetical protein